MDRLKHHNPWWGRFLGQLIYRKTKRLFILIIASITMSCPKGDPYTYNHNLKLLTGDTVNFLDHSTCPVVSPDGEKVYFLSLSEDEWSDDYNFQDGVGRLYEIKSDGSGRRRLLDDIFSALAISSDGEKLAANLWPDSSYDKNPIVLIDVKSLARDTFWVPYEDIGRIQFGSNDFLYFSSTDNIFRLCLIDTTIEYIGSGLGFDVYPEGGLYINSKLHYFEINPDRESLAISSNGDLFLLLNLNSQKIDTLPGSLVPYFFGVVDYPYWFPSGNKIVFVCAHGSYEFPNPAQLWILENFFEYRRY